MFNRPALPLGNFLDLVTYGFTNPMPTTDSGPVMVTAKDINSGRILYEQARSTSERAFADLLTAKSRPLLGDVLVTKDGTLGRMAIVDRPGICVNQSVAVLRPSPLIRSRFLKYLLEEPSNFQRMIADADGSTIKHIYISRLARMPVNVPSVEVQDDILSVLGPLDDKIELNRRMNGTLEAMAQAIFRDWFVDFGPVRRKQAGAVDPIEIMGTLTPNPAQAAKLASVFPDELDHEGLPAGWGPGVVSDLVEFNPKEPLKKGAVAPYSDMSSLPTIGSSADAPVMREYASGMRFRNGDALIARITPCLENGKTAFVDFMPDAETVGWGSTEFIVMRAASGTPAPFSYLICRHPEFRDHAIQSMTGTSGRQRAQADSLMAWPIAKPTPEVLITFGEFVIPFFDKMSALAAENRTLAEARDYLLPRLMSGRSCIEATL